MEAPTYLGAIMAFQSFEAEVGGVPVDEDGLEVDELERLLETGPAPKSSTRPTSRTPPA